MTANDTLPSGVTRRLREKPIVMALAGSLILLLVYMGILTVSESFDHAITQLTELWYWIAPLVVGFGAQVGLYSYIRGAFRTRIGATTGAMATAGGVSTTSMIACCAHHLTDVLPILGLSAAAVFLTEYQPVFMSLGILSNFVGITVMLTVMQKHNLVSSEGISKKIFRYDMKRIRNTAIASSIIIMLGITVSTIAPLAQTSAGTGVVQAAGLEPIVNEQNGVSFQITPIDFSYDKSVTFEVRIDTHQGSLDFDLADVSVLETSDGRRFSPLSWEGSPPGGHHRSGILTFPDVGETEFLKLAIQDVNEDPERIFVWNLQSSGRAEAMSSTPTNNNYVLGGTLVAVILTVVVMNFTPRNVKQSAKYEKLLQDKYRKLRETNE
ncbi:MAG: hypothetical protein ACE5KU_00950 [Nitrososphaerales archaeon]